MQLCERCGRTVAAIERVKASQSRERQREPSTRTPIIETSSPTAWRGVEFKESQE